MKKQLLLGVALFSAMSAFTQNASSRPQKSGVMAEKISRKFSAIETQSSAAAKPTAAPATEVTNPLPQPQEQSALAAPNSTISWKLLSGSNNVNGQLVSNSKPLQYNPNVNAVSYIHRKSASYVSA